jgi:hypothetical protein
MTMNQKIEINNIKTRAHFGTIRKEWNKNEEKWYFSVVDIVGIVTESSNPRNYWKVLKNRLKKRDNQLVTECNQLKLKASDGKFYLTDVGTVDTITEIIKLLDPQNTLVFKAWALALNRPKEVNTSPIAKVSMKNEMYIKNKDKNYPQVKYNLSNLIKKTKPE